MCLGEKKIAIVLQIKKSDNWFRFAHLQPTKTRRTTTITALDLPNLNDLKIFYSLQDLSPTTGGPVLNEGDNEGDFDDLLPGNIVVGLRPGPTKPRAQTRAQPLSLMPRMPWMIQSFLLADFLQRKRMRTTLMICCWETLLLAWNWVQPTSHKHELNRYNWCQGCLGPSSWLLFFSENENESGSNQPNHEHEQNRYHWRQVCLGWSGPSSCPTFFGERKWRRLWSPISSRGNLGT